MNAWYATLKRPALSPPDWVFSPVWTVLYVSIAVAIFLYYRTPVKPRVGMTTALLAFHLLTNFIWTWLFFGLRSPGLGLVDIVLLDVSLVGVMMMFARANPLAAGILVPYLLWVSFATYLNAAFYRLN